MFAGCAIVASDCLGVREILKNGLNGFIVPLKNPEIMANRILELVRDDKIRLSFANAAKHDILDFTIDNTCQEFLDKILLSEICANNSNNVDNR